MNRPKQSDAGLKPVMHPHGTPFDKTPESRTVSLRRSLKLGNAPNVASIPPPPSKMATRPSAPKRAPFVVSRQYTPPSARLGCPARLPTTLASIARRSCRAASAPPLTVAANRVSHSPVIPRAARPAAVSTAPVVGLAGSAPSVNVGRVGPARLAASSRSRILISVGRRTSLVVPPVSSPSATPATPPTTVCAHCGSPQPRGPPIAEAPPSPPAMPSQVAVANPLIGSQTDAVGTLALVPPPDNAPSPSSPSDAHRNHGDGHRRHPPPPPPPPPRLRPTMRLPLATGTTT
ncbi:hypothetical protein DFH07DRAFT_6168 [Mycena maculata]|uniref:Uncharacterized protein n=1 Tax=Mycena maculata TaxID=230809 RepID=A0AAD7KGR8_9AGAR|nr:hypothetical protein DFH07DRAFT_6168 [Mycena maculata]